MPGKKTGIVTGASGGIGSGLLARFLIERHTVIATSRNANAKLTVSGSPAALAGDILRKSLALMLAICSVDCRRKPQICCCQQARPYLQGGFRTRAKAVGRSRLLLMRACQCPLSQPHSMSASARGEMRIIRTNCYQPCVISSAGMLKGLLISTPLERRGFC